MSVRSARDLRTDVSDLRPDALATGVVISEDWCRAQMCALGITRYEDVDAAALRAIAARVDTLAPPTPECRS